MENSKLRVCRRQSSCGSINEDMEKLFQRLELESRNIGLAMTRANTKLMIADRARKLPYNTVTCNIPGINIVDRFIYLGSPISYDGNIWKKRGIGIQSKKLTDTVCSIPYLPVWSRNVNCLGSRKAKGAFEMWC
ncbi:unnamed protein product [Pieris macdunnoughi]|uniref:Uncharacterized protein n=1 Tax=Pieris macdunnoughi TaxID=345717 RepID=A0A821V3F5_9NEOP|nr:unnamed protein product [Pieris macdunnoughi]